MHARLPAQAALGQCTDPSRRPALSLRRPVGPAARQQAVARRRNRTLLTRLLAAALLVAVLTGFSSLRMHDVIRGEQQAGGESSGLRGWLSGGRRSLRERRGSLDGDFTLRLRDPGAQGVLLHDEWWLIGAPAGGVAGYRRWVCNPFPGRPQQQGRFCAYHMP